jgi:predicted peroxiredoxin
VADKLVIVVTHGPTEPERATIPFVMALGALALDTEVTVAFQCDGVDLAVNGAVDGIHAEGFAPLAELLTSFRDFGGKFLVCSPFLKPRGITSDRLIEGVEEVAAARLVLEMTDATVLTY